MKIKNVEVKIVQADIRKLKVEAIACANNMALNLKEGLAKLISTSGRRARRDKPTVRKKIARADAVWSPATGKLACRYVIYTAIVDKNKGLTEDIIRRSCRNILCCASDLKVKSLALPSLVIAKDPFPQVGGAKIMTQEILKFVRFEKTSLKEIIFCLSNPQEYHVFEQTVSGYLHHVQDTLGDGPYATVDAIIEMKEGIVLIERSNPPYGLALPGGFVDYGESLEEAIQREAMEETGLTLKNLRQFHTYSAFGRDPRFHTISTVFTSQGQGIPRSGDDAKGLKIIRYSELMNFDYAFDHKDVIKDYLNYKGLL